MKSPQSAIAVLAIVAALLIAGYWVFSRRTSAPPGGTASHAVLIHFRLSDGAFGSDTEVEQLQALELKLEQAIVRSGAGELDGHEMGQGEYVIFTYGRDADKLFSAIEPVLRATKLAPGTFVIKRYGPPEDENARETRLDL